MSRKIGIIGGGFGGLSAAIRLAKLGFNVDLFEQNETVGGKANSISLDGFRFDTGPSLLTMPCVLNELFDFVDEEINDYIQLQSLDILCKYFYSDGLTVNAYSDRGKLINEFSTKFGESEKLIEKYLNYSKQIYDLTAELFLFKSFSEISTFFNLSALKTLLQINKLDTFRTMHVANESFFNNKKAIQLFDRYATYNGSNPYLAPATLNIIQHVEYNLGAFIAKKGIYSISLSLESIAKNVGVNIYKSSKVEQILHEKKRVDGLLINGNVKKYHAIISNSDVNNTYKNLLGDNSSKSAIKYSKLQPSSSAIVFYWGVKGNYDNLEIHNILFSEDYQNEFDEIFTKKSIPSDPTIYIYVSSKFNSEDAPPNSENWFVMLNAPFNSGQEWKIEIEKLREIIIRKIERQLGISLRENIVCESILNPLKIESKTSSMYGSLYGISSNNKYAAFLRQRNRSKEYKGLYFCGGSAHPGGGIPLVLLSGKITAELVEKDFK
ncbi:MAG TPA: phytoene desaturase family protein [Ignavibacteriaceae bacterium]|nr:phytoene desaturase family protein [Ignavibacteriaceae bacterium]